MIRLLLLVGAVGAAGFAAARLRRAKEGTITDTAQRSAETVRQRGPGVVDSIARGVERLGEGLEKGVSKIRQRDSETVEGAATEVREDAPQEFETPSDVPEDER